MSEPVQIVELTVPRCGLRFGVAPCTATTADGPRCFNFWGGCLAKAAYDPTGSITYRFAAAPIPGLVEQVGDNDIRTDAMAGLKGISEVSSSINPEGRRKGQLVLGETALGTAGAIRLTFDNIQHDDHQGDFYRAERGRTGGTFWGKFNARVPYLSTARVRVLYGQRGQALDDMQARTYLPTEIKGPDASGSVSLEAVSPLRVPRIKETTFPATTNASLAFAINPTQATILVDTTEAAELSKAYGNVATFYLRIGDEIIGYSGAVDQGDGRYSLSGVTRAALGTTAAAHEAEEDCQRVGRYEGLYPWEIAHDLITAHTAIPAEFCDLSAWHDALFDTGWLFTFDGTVEEPLPVFDLVGELAQSSMSTYAWDDRAGQIVAIPIAYTPPVGTLDRAREIVRNSEAVTQTRGDQLSRVFIRYGRRDPTQGFDQIGNIQFVDGVVNETAEDTRAGGTPVELVIDSRWIRNTTQAQKVCAYLRDRFAEGSWNYTFRTLDRGYSLGDVVIVSTPLREDTEGAEVLTRWRIISKTEQPDGTTTYRADEDPFRAVQRPGKFAPNDLTDFESATVAERLEYMYFTDSDGLGPDGLPGPQLS